MFAAVVDNVGVLLDIRQQVRPAMHQLRVPEDRVGLVQADPVLTLKAINLRKFGQEIIRILGGRRIHPNFAIPGGVNKSLKTDERVAALVERFRALVAQDTIMVGAA